MDEKMLCIPNVAKRLGCSSRHVYDLIKRGELDAVRVGVKSLRVPEAALREFLMDRFVESDATV